MRLALLLTTAASAAFLAACTPANKAPAEPAASEPSTTEPESKPLHVAVLDCGSIAISDLDAFSTAGDYAGQADEFTDTCYVVHHPKGILLWDLGLPGILKEGGPMTQEIFTVSLNETITDQLGELGLTPADVTYFAISHSHFDHIGQVDQVKDSTWLVHQTELDFMIPPDGSAPQTSADQVAQFSLFKDIKREPFTGEKDVFGDGTVVIFETPGHTPGHTSLQLKMPESGYVLLSGDLYHRAESRPLSRVPRFNFNEEQTRASMAAFEQRATDLGAKVIIQHEPADIAPLGGVIR